MENKLMLILLLHTSLVHCINEPYFQYCGPQKLSSVFSRNECKQESIWSSEFGNTSTSLKNSINRIQNEKCRRQLLTFAAALRNSSPWAVRMFHSGTKMLHDSDDYQLGHFDECIEVNIGRRERESINGKYCLVDIVFRGGRGDVAGRKVQRVGVCVPDKCQTQDVETITRIYFKEFGNEGNVTVSRDACTTSEPAKERSGAKVLKFIVFVIVLIDLGVTFLDLLTRNSTKVNDLWHKIAEIFSCHRNIRKLTNAQDREVFSGVDIARVIAIILLIIYRRFQVMAEGPIRNGKYFLEWNMNFGSVFDILIFTTGFIIARNLHNNDDLASRWKCFLLCVTKWLRLAPLYGVVIAFYAFAFEEIGNGPLWLEKIGREARHCRAIWWANLSFINNYISASRQCIAQSWYLSVIAHCSLVTMMFMHLKKRKAYVGLITFGLSVSAVMILFSWNDFVLATKPGNINVQEMLKDLYIKTHNRAPSFAIGCFSAILCDYITKSKAGIGRAQIVMISLIYTLFGLVSAIYKSLSYKSGIESQILYATASSLLFSLFIGCIVITATLCGFRLFTSSKLRSIFVFLDKLSFSALLSHALIQLYLVGTMRSEEYVTYPRLVWMGLADVFVSYIFATVFHLFIEAPVFAMIDFIVDRKINDNEQSDS